MSGPGENPVRVPELSSLVIVHIQTQEVHTHEDSPLLETFSLEVVTSACRASTPRRSFLPTLSIPVRVTSVKPPWYLSLLPQLAHRPHSCQISSGRQLQGKGCPRGWRASSQLQARGPGWLEGLLSAGCLRGSRLHPEGQCLCQSPGLGHGVHRDHPRLFPVPR